MVKEIGKYKIKFFGKFSDSSDKLNLVVSIDSGLKKFLRECTASGETQDLNIPVGRDNNGGTQHQKFKRYLIKTPLRNTISYINGFECVFIKELLDNGRFTIEFNDFDSREKVKKAVKDTIKVLIQRKSDATINETVDITVKSE
ncbi:MAG: hypothetical protein IH948_00095 [Bacteroidetes bacterium]|nr:hypothetical protein [Bacteroidota bacterium]